MSPPAQPEKIAILGGGMAAMTAAFALTNQPGWQTHYDITLYQMGWRLGGKGASGRNKDKRDRIEEHGLHIWMGMYENAFQLMQECYAELGRVPGTDPLATWDAAFKKHSFCTMMEQVDNAWLPWSFNVPTNDGVPGQGGVCLSIGNLIRRILQWVSGSFGLPLHASAADPAVVHLHNARSQAEHLGEPGHPHTAAAHESIVTDLDTFRKQRFAAFWGQGTQWATALRRDWILLDLAITLARGLLADHVTTSFDPLDRYDFREWLTLHGASPVSVWSAPIRCIYELVFAYEGGDPNAPRLGAGVALRFVLRSIFSYQGAFIWFMQAGMGDAVFAPLFLVLKQRGVKFKFFHRVENLGLSANMQSIDTIQISRQATMKAGDYQPLVKVKGLDCWPATALADQFIDSERLAYQDYCNQGIEVFESAWSPWTNPASMTLQRGVDFDRVVLGIALGALKYVCKDLVADNAAWQNMVAQVQTVQTQGFQLWLNRDAIGLGWTNVPEPAILDSYRDSWADFSHLIPVENWPTADNVRSIACFCNTLQEVPNVPDPSANPAFQLSQKQRVHDISLGYLKTGLTVPLWPLALNPANPNELDWTTLVDPTGASADARFDYQFWRANIDPTERYVQSIPNSTQYRLQADQSGYDNLVLAGDWLKTGINAGCIEAAVMGGLQASRAISGYPAVVFGEQDFCATGSVALTGVASYIRRGGEQVFCQPASLTGVDFYAFMLQGSTATLQQLCDRYLNIPGQNQVRYVAFTPTILLTVAYIARVQSQTPPDNAMGWITETDASFWVPLLAVDQVGWSLPRLVWFQPYLFVDNALAVAAGREIYGFAKETATFPSPASWTFQAPRAAAGAPGPVFSASALAIKQYGVNSQAVPTTLIDVRRQNAASPGGLARQFNRLADVQADILAALVGPGGAIAHPETGLALDPLGLLASLDVRQVFLKEFRDAVDGTQACYQAIVEAPATIGRVGSMGSLTGPYQVTITQCDSHPMIAELGLPQPGAPTDDVVLSVANAWYLNFDFDIGNGEIIWDA